MNLDQIFQHRMRRQPDAPAILAAHDRLTYAELDARIQGFADALRAAGVRPRDCVGLHCASGQDYIALTYAVWRCGGCAVPIPQELAPPEKRQLLSEIGLQHVISDAPGADGLQGLSARAAVPLSDRHQLGRVDEPAAIPPEFATLNSAFIRFTSGTTGHSKGVVLSHETIFERIESANDVLGLGPDDRVVWLLSMSYHFAVSIVAYLTYGAAIILPCNLFAPAIVDAIRQHRGTFLYGSPLHYAWLKDFRGPADLSHVRLAISTTTAIDADLARAFHERFGIPVTQALGIIEVGLPCINLDYAAVQPDAIGNILPAYEVRLEPTDLGEEYRELFLRGPGLFDAYYRPWRRRDDCLDNGWFSTGDVVTVGEDGCLRIRGRSKDVINIAGMKFFPQEVEDVLRAHPAIQSARVYAVRDSRWGETALAQVIPRSNQTALPSPQELATWCRARLAPFKVPSGIEFVAAFPRTASGKVLHRPVAAPAVPKLEGDPCSDR